MYEYSPTITRTAKNYNLQERDVIFCHLVAAGIDRADAYHVVYNRGKSSRADQRSTADAAAADLQKNHPGTQLLIQKIKNRQPINTNGTQQEVKEANKEKIMKDEGEGAGDELATRSGLTKKMRQEIAFIHGKEAVSGLMTLAKLEGFDKEDNRTEEEKRKYFLPWRSRCRGCKLMQIFRQLEEEKTEKP